MLLRCLLPLLVWGQLARLGTGILVTPSAQGEQAQAPDLHAWQPRAQTPAEAANVTGAFRGTWRLSIHDPRTGQPPMLQRQGGVLVFQLRGEQGDGGDAVVQKVQGEVVMRDGHSIADDDVRLHLDGFFVPDTGRLHGVLLPARPVYERPAPQGLGYRAALRVAAHEWLRLQDGGPGGAGAAPAEPPSPECRFRFDVSVRRREPSSSAASPAGGSQAAAGPAWHSLLLRNSRGGGPAPAAAAMAGPGAGLDPSRGHGAGSSGLSALEPGRRLQQWPDPVQFEGRGFRPGQRHQRWRRSRDPPQWPQPQQPWLLPQQQQQLEEWPQPLQQQPTSSQRQPADVAALWESDMPAARLDAARGPQAGSAPAAAAAAAAPAELLVDGTITSDNCHVAWSVVGATLHLDRYYVKAVRYSLSMTAVSLAHIMLLVWQMEASATPSAAGRVSLATISHLSLLDAYLCLLHLTAALVLEALFNALATAAFFQFVVFAVFQMRFLLLVWRAQRPGGMGDGWSARRELSLLYTRFYGCLLAGVFLAYHLQAHLPLLLGLPFSFWVPQIVHSVVHDARAPLRPGFILGTSALRLLLPLYLLACPHNVLRLAPRPWLCGGLVAWVGLQAAVLLSQHMWGSRWFVPAAWLPPKYDYHRAALPRHSNVALPDMEEGGEPAGPAGGGGLRRPLPAEASLARTGSSGCAACLACAQCAPTPNPLLLMAPAQQPERSVRTATLRRLSSSSGPGSLGRSARRSSSSSSGGVASAVPEGRTPSWQAGVISCWAGSGGSVLSAASISSPPPELQPAGQPGGGACAGCTRCSRQASVAADIGDLLGRPGDASTATECVICMSLVEVHEPRARMCTPCGHFFHPPCLVRWMDVKMECPTCRSPLPPL